MPADLEGLFAELKPHLARFSPPLDARVDVPRRYELWSGKSVVIDGRKRKDVYFGALIIQSKYVGFYFMPVYLEDDVKRTFGPELLETLKGKSCFHINRLDNTLLGQIDAALDAGFAMYRERGWL